MSQFEQIEALFHEAAALPEGADRAGFVASRCLGDESVRREVLALLDARQEITNPGNISPPPQANAPSGRFGVWQTEEPIGRGGMSVVYRAVRADGQFQQTAALKIMAGYLSGPEFLKRFETERQLLATLNHENITRLLDGGLSASGDPWLVTEFVDGETIDRYCDRRKLDVKARLSVFLQVAEAVDYAHRNLIVHRDLKPANILVNNDGTVKLLDFGTASLMAGTGETAVTRTRMLTPRYASPEQLRGEHLSTATDVFSLGVVLFELLTGAWPFGEPESLLTGLNRATTDVPAKSPATVLTDASAESRSVSRKQLGRILKGDLSAVVLKALESDPARRYESVRQLADDIERYLGGRPVMARPQTALYRSGRFLRRHWIPAAASAVFVIGLAGASLAALHEAHVAEAHYAELRSLTTMLLFELKNAITDVPGSTQAQKILVTRVVKSLNLMTGQTAQDPQLRLNLAEAWRQMGELQGSPYGQNLGDPEGASASLAKARSIVAAELTARPSDPATLRAAAAIEETAGEVDFGMGRTHDAVSHLSSAVALGDRLLAVSAALPDLTQVAVIHQVLGDVYGQPGMASLADPAEAALHYRRTIELDETALRRDRKNLRAARGIAILHMKLGDLYRFADPESALADYRQAIRAYDALPLNESNRPANVRFRAAFVRKTGETLTALRQWSEAEPYLLTAQSAMEAALAADPGDARAKNDLCTVLSAFLDFYDAQDDLKHALPMAERTVALLEDLASLQPDSAAWRMTRGYYRYRLSTLLDKIGEHARAAAVGRDGSMELRRIADAKDPPPESLALASEAFARIEPASLRNPALAVSYALRYRQIRPSGDASALYRLAIAQHAAGDPAAASTARLAMAAMATPREGRTPTPRLELEAIH